MKKRLSPLVILFFGLLTSCGQTSKPKVCDDPGVISQEIRLLGWDEPNSPVKYVVASNSAYTDKQTGTITCVMEFKASVSEGPAIELTYRFLVTMADDNEHFSIGVLN